MAKVLSRREFLNIMGLSSLLFLPKIPGSKFLEGAAQWQAAGPEVPGLSIFDDTMKAFMQARGITAGALAVSRNSKLVLARGYTNSDNPSDITVQPNSLFRIASISKPITAAAVLRLVQDGLINLSDKLTDILNLTPPPGGTADPRLKDVTIRSLLQHLGGWDPGMTFDPMFYDAQIASALGISLPASKNDIITYMTGQPLQHTPGTTYAYSNYGYCLLGRIIEQVSGMPYDDYVSKAVFRPLGIWGVILGRSLSENRAPGEVTYHSMYMDTTVMDTSGESVPQPYGAFNLENMDAHGGWLTSAVDLVRFASTFDDPSSSPVLNQDSVDTLFGLPENIDPGDYQAGDWYYACGWAVRDWGGNNRNTWHDGSLPGTHTLMVRRWDGLDWAVVFNQRDDPSGLGYNEIDDLLHQAADQVTSWPDHDLFSLYLRMPELYLPFITG